MKRRDHTGERFGRLVALYVDESSRPNDVRWCCRCDCGQTCVARAGSLRSGSTKSCGCIRRELARTKGIRHGYTKFPEYTAWKQMLDRCYDPGDISFANYGARGISVCEDWRISFPQFLTDVGQRPSPEYSIDRIDNDGHYTPDNVRWATRTMQGNNRRTNTLLTVNGETKTAMQWARHFRLPPQVLYDRLANGWSIERAIRTPVRAKRRAKTEGYT